MIECKGSPCDPMKSSPSSTFQHHYQNMGRQLESFVVAITMLPTFTETVVQPQIVHNRYTIILHKITSKMVTKERGVCKKME